MRLLHRVGVAAMWATTAVGCATLAKIDELEKVECVVDCDPGATSKPGAALDASFEANVSAQPDATGGPGASPDATTGAPDTGSDASRTDADAAGTDANVDADAGSACGPTNTILNCSACGKACDTATSSARTCDGTKCSYTCAAGRASCNTAAPDTDGCECATPGCCAGACQTTHSNGLGKSFYDCVPAGTRNAVQARAACAAFTGDASQCTSLLCVAGGYDLVCSTGSPLACACWDYSSGAAGRVHNTGLTGLPNCWCPDTNDPSWN